MKVVFSTDWHGDWTTLGEPRFDEIADAARLTVRAAIVMKAAAYIFAGDLAETEGPGMLRTLELAVGLAGALWKEGIPSYWLTGNHDVIEDGRSTSNLTPLRDVPGATLIDSPELRLIALNPFEGRSLIAAFLPFVPRTHSYDPAAFVRDNVEPGDPRPDLVVGHLMLEGIGPGSETRDMPRGRDVFWPLKEIQEHWPKALKVGGHYHERQVYRGVHIPGSLARLTKTEIPNIPSYLVADL